MCTELQVLSKTAYRLWFYAYKNTRTVTMQDVPLLNVTSDCPYATADVAILVREYQANFQKLHLQTSFSREWLIVLPRYFARQFKRSRLMTYFKKSVHSTSTLKSTMYSVLQNSTVKTTICTV